MCAQRAKEVERVPARGLYLVCKSDGRVYCAYSPRVKWSGDDNWEGFETHREWPIDA